MSVVGVRRFRAPFDALSDARNDAPATRLIAPESARVGILAALAVLAGVIAVGPMVRHNMFWTGDAPFFYAIAHHPFGSGGVSAHPLQFGVAYRYGRILFPLASWLASFGRPQWVAGGMLLVYVTSVGFWVATAAEHLRRSGRRPWLALSILGLPFSVMAFFRPEAVSDPMAGALLLTVYLYERQGRTRAAYVAAALMILTREPMALAVAPMLWIGWRRRGRVVLRDAAVALGPYALWLVWVRVRVGQFPFLDPAVSRREALAAPLEGYLQTLRLGGGWTQQFGMVVALVTLLGAVLVAAHGRGRPSMRAGLIMLAAVIPFLGIAVFRHPLEAFRVLVPIQALLIVVTRSIGARRSRRPRPRPADSVTSSRLAVDKGGVLDVRAGRPPREPVRQIRQASASLSCALARLAVAASRALTIAIASLGASPVRPIADDLDINGKLVALHGAVPALQSWMQTWTGYYSEYGSLTALAAATRAVGLGRYTFGIASLVCLALIVLSIRCVVAASRRLRLTQWGAAEIVLLAAGLLGSFSGPLKESSHANLYEALYWASAWTSHLAPVLLCPIVAWFVVTLRNRHARVAVALVSGFVVAGFGLAETIIAAAIVAASTWLALRLCDRGSLLSYRPALAAGAGGLVGGSVLVEKLPGTASRARFMTHVHLGLAAHHGVAATFGAACSLAWSDAKAVVLSPAPVLGLLIGLLLCLAPLSRNDASIERALPNLLAASWVVAAIGVVAVAMGDLGSYQASWHLLPLIAVVYPACVLTGYALGTRSRAVHLPAAVTVFAVLALAWTTTQAASAARVSFARARVFDRDVHAAEVAKRNPHAVATWRSMSIAGITDAAPPGPNGFAGDAIQQWLGISSAQLDIVPVPEPEVDLFDW